jgi:pimeloyl-ACP methyl ester carboxylesterase
LENLIRVYKKREMKRIVCVLAVLLSFFVATTGADDSDTLLTVDHYVRVKSTVPVMAGQPAQLYVRERVTAGAALRAPSLADRVVLFVHGAGTPAEVAFDVPPTLMITGAHDKQVLPQRVREFYEDLATPEKVFIDLACSSHNAMWERNHVLLFRASLEWLTRGTVNGTKTGMLKLGYAGVPESR